MSCSDDMLKAMQCARLEVSRLNNQLVTADAREAAQIKQDLVAAQEAIRGLKKFCDRLARNEPSVDLD